MERPEKFVIALDDENTVATTRPYFANNVSAPAVAPSAPGPAIVVPVRSGINAKMLAMVTAAALFCGAFGGWALGLYQRQDTTPPTAQSEEAPPAEEIPQPPVTDAPDQTFAPEVALAGAGDEKKDSRTAPKPVLKPAKPKPVAEKTPAKTDAPKEKTEEPAPNGGTRPRRANGDNERAGREGKANGKNDGDLHHSKH